jgi:MFS family permease
VSRNRIEFLFLNVGHFLDHLFLLVFATAAALSLAREWGMSYAELIPYATPGFIMFAVCSIPAGWIADKWSREGMMAIFFIGIGASSILAAGAETPLQIAFGLAAIGLFAAIYHPVGLAMVIQGREKTGVALAINGIYGNLGVASAALLTGYLIDKGNWREAFVLPGAVAVVIGIAYTAFIIRGRKTAAAEDGPPPSHQAIEAPAFDRRMLVRLFSVIFFSTAVGGLIFQSTTFSLPKIFDERLGDIAASASLVGWYAFMVFAIAALAQLGVGYLVDRHSIRTVFACVAAMQAVFLAAMFQMTGIGVLFVSVAFMLFVFGQIPINDVLVGRVTTNEWRSRVFAFRYLLTFSVSASAVPLIAWIHGRWGFDTLFIVLSAAAAAIFCSVLLLPRTGPVLGPGRTAPAE